MILILDIARGVAALWVFFFHVNYLFDTASPIILKISEYGNLGVPMFFVISGYVITYSAEANLSANRAPTAFLKARFLRIYPTFWASILIVFATPYVIEAISFVKTGNFESPTSYLENYNALEWANIVLLTKVFWATSHDLQSEFNGINSVYWTLAIEFQFYLVVFLALHLKNNYKHTLLLVTVIAIATKTFSVNFNPGLFIHYWLSFSVGIALAYIHRCDIWSATVFANRPIVRLATISISILFMIISAVYSNIEVLFSLSFGVFLWAISNIEKLLIHIKSGKNRLMLWILEPWLILGTMSYTVYLLHAKIHAIPNMFVRQIVDPNNIFFGLLTILGTLFMCYPFYLFIERKFLSKNYKKLHKKALSIGSKIT